MAAIYMLLVLLSAVMTLAVTGRSLLTVPPTRSIITSNIPLKTCYDDILSVHDVVPTFSSDIKPLMLSSMSKH